MSINSKSADLVPTPGVELWRSKGAFAANLEVNWPEGLGAGGEGEGGEEGWSFFNLSILVGDFQKETLICPSVAPDVLCILNNCVIPGSCVDYKRHLLFKIVTLSCDVPFWLQLFSVSHMFESWVLRGFSVALFYKKNNNDSWVLRWLRACAAVL